MRTTGEKISVVSPIMFLWPSTDHPSLIATFSLPRLRFRQEKADHFHVVRSLHLAASNSTRIADTLTSLGMNPVSE